MRYLLTLLLLLSCPSLASASSVTIDAVFDWSGFHYITVAPLTAFDVVPALGPTVGVATTGAATGTNDNGRLSLTATAYQEAPARAQVSAFDVFWFYGVGSGDLAFRVPYDIIVTSTSDVGRASGDVTIRIGPGVEGPPDSVAFDVRGAGTWEYTGVLDTARFLNEPWWGPLVTLELTGDVYAGVPEPSTWWLLLSGAGWLALLYWRTS